MTDKAQARPPQVTLLGGVILAGSVLMVALVFDRMSSLGSIDAQEEAQRFVDAGLGRGLGVDADQWQSVLRALCLVAGAAGVVTAYLGWQVLQRDRRSRLALSLLVPVLLVAGVPTADFVATTLVVAVVLLWRQPARDWLDGKAVARPPARTESTRPPAPAPTPTSTPTSTPVPVYDPSAVAAKGAPPAYPGPGQGGPGQGGPVQGGPVQGGPRRPGTVLAAVITTIVSSVVVLLGCASTAVLFATSRSTFESDLRDQLDSQEAYRDLDVATVVNAVVVMLVVFSVWAVAAIVLAVLTARGSNGARIGLVVSSFAVALTGLLLSLAIFPLIITAVGITVGVLLLRGDAVGWFAAGRGERPTAR